MPAAVTAIFIFLCAGGLLYVAMAAMIARALLRPPRMSDGKAAYVLKRVSPIDLGMKYQALDFVVRDGRTGAELALAAWFIPHPAPAGKCVVLLHGYADAKIGAIAWAPVFRELGYHVVAVDLRAHGQSEGTTTSAGYWERHDVSQVIDQLRAMRPNDTRRLVLFGASLGAAVAAATCSLRDDVDALVLDSPFADFRLAALAHLYLLGMPGPWMGRFALTLAERQAGVEFGPIAPPKTIEAAPCPVMLTCSELDPFCDPDSRQTLREAVEAKGTPSRFYLSAETAHLMTIVDDPAGYRARLGEFLEEAMRARQAAARV